MSSDGIVAEVIEEAQGISSPRCIAIVLIALMGTGFLALVSAGFKPGPKLPQFTLTPTFAPPDVTAEPIEILTARPSWWARGGRQSPPVVSDAPLAPLSPISISSNLVLSEFRQMVFDEFRAALTENGTESESLDLKISKKVILEYEQNGTPNVTRFLADNAKFRRKPAPEDNEMVFVAGGDWGHKLNKKLSGRPVEVAAAMHKTLSEIPGITRSLAFGVLLGDNWYPAGLKDVNDRRRHEFDIKILQFLSLRVPYYVVVGNHDSYGSADAQVEFTLKHPYWNCPSFQYVTPIIRRGAITVQLFVLNTRLHFDQNFPLIPPQAPWLDEQLSKSTAMWKIVMTHEPIFSFVNFEHERALVQHIHPILMKHKVPLFIAGHAHHLSLFQCPGGYFQLTSGAMNALPQKNLATRRPKGGFNLTSGFQRVHLTATSATVVATNFLGVELWSTVIPLDPEERLKLFESTDPWLWKPKKQCEAHLPVKLPGC